MYRSNWGSNLCLVDFAFSFVCNESNTCNNYEPKKTEINTARKILMFDEMNLKNSFNRIVLQIMDSLLCFSRCGQLCWVVARLICAHWNESLEEVFLKFSVHLDRFWPNFHGVVQTGLIVTSVAAWTKKPQESQQESQHQPKKQNTAQSTRFNQSSEPEWAKLPFQIFESWLCWRSTQDSGWFTVTLSHGQGACHQHGPGTDSNWSICTAMLRGSVLWQSWREQALSKAWLMEVPARAHAHVMES
jgi:hypothetical protein